MTPDEEMRFWSKVLVVESCWEWIGHDNGRGYGTFYRRGDRHVYAHRVSFEHFRGPIPNGMEIDHLCRNRRCVNPDHLEAVTPQENMRRTHKKVCVRGHDFSGDNVYLIYSGKERRCKQCQAIRGHSYYVNRRSRAAQRQMAD